ncbi:MAG: methyltransferase domain-containing protein [Deinococcota bacterium]
MATAQTQGELWSKAVQDWAELQEQGHVPLLKAMLNATNVGQGTCLLDVGCGAGGASVLAAELGAEVTGLDAAEGMIAYAQKRLPDANFHVGDMANLPFSDDSFDVVFAANSIQYAEDRVAALQELARVCKSGGHVVAGLVGSPDKVAYRHIFQAVRSTLPEPPAGKGPFELSAPGKLASLFEEAGLSITTQGDVTSSTSFPDLESYLRGVTSGGPVQAALQVVDEEKLKAALIETAKPFLTDNGQIVIEPNNYIYVVATL